MIYKGIIFDIDGTAVPLGALEASKRLQQAIAQGQQSLALCAATGRSIGVAKPIIESLGLTGPCVIMGGAAIIDATSFTALWQQSMSREQVAAINTVLQSYQTLIFCGHKPEVPAEEVRTLPKTELLVVYALEVAADKTDELIKELSGIEGVAAHPTPSWNLGRVDVHITHETGTKEHGIHELKRILGLHTADLIGVGDSANDMPIFKAVGHKVAMGNAEQALKDLADEIALPVDDDGLARIIEKYTDH